jgi:hypothetical protein
VHVHRDAAVCSIAEGNPSRSSSWRNASVVEFQRWTAAVDEEHQSRHAPLTSGGCIVTD